MVSVLFISFLFLFSFSFSLLFISISFDFLFLPNCFLNLFNFPGIAERLTPPSFIDGSAFIVLLLVFDSF